MVLIHQRHRRTDGQRTTCNLNTALCTKVHRAVKTTAAHIVQQNADKTGFMLQQSVLVAWCTCARCVSVVVSAYTWQRRVIVIRYILLMGVHASDAVTPTSLL